MALTEEIRTRTVVGGEAPRIDAVPKITGQAAYAADVPVPGVLHARLVLSSHAHARIGRIDAADAAAVPGVVAVLTADDLPLADGPGRAFEPLARDEVVFAGQPVALVVAETEAAAEDAVTLVEVGYASLEAILDVERAVKP